MNKERILALADHIEKLDHDIEGNYFNGINGFNMRSYKDACGSPACIAGWAVHLDSPERLSSISIDLVLGDAAQLLEINKDMAEELFEPDYISNYSTITPERAAKVLRHLAETGKVEWDLSVHGANSEESETDE